MHVPLLEAVLAAKNILLMGNARSIFGLETSCNFLFSFSALLELFRDYLFGVIVFRRIYCYLFKRLQWEHFQFTFIKLVIVVWNILDYAALFKL